MEDQLSRKYNAAKTGLDVMHQNDSLWNTHSAIVAKVDAAETSLGKIRDLGMEANSEGRTHSASKSQKKKAAAMLAAEILGSLKIFAEDTLDETLKGQTNLRESSLSSGKDIDCMDRWEMIRDAATSHLSALVAAGFPVTALGIDELDDAITAFGNIASLPVTKRSNHKAAREEMVREFKILDKNLDATQLLLKTLARSHPQFYGNVIDAFEVVGTGVRHQCIRITFIDKESGVRLEGINARVKETGLSRKSKEAGVVTIKSAEVENGSYTLEISKSGYVSQTISGVKVESGSMTRVEVVLEREIDN